MKATFERFLVEQTGKDLAAWQGRIQAENLADEPALRAWLASQGVTGYAQSYLVMEQFGYPGFFLHSADELIEAQYADRAVLRPILDAILAVSAELGDVTIQARKTYVSLVTPRRTFARVQPTTKTRVDLGLRLERQKPGERLRPSKIHETTPLQISLFSVSEVDKEVEDWLRRAYAQNI